MHRTETWPPAIAALKPANKAEQSAAKSWSEGQGRRGDAQALERIRQVFAVTHVRWEPYCGGLSR